MTKRTSQIASSGTDPYTTLGVDKTATKDQIKKAYYDRAKQHHPDVGGDPESFLPVKLAYETLIDDERRAFFDTFGEIPGSVEAKEMKAPTDETKFHPAKASA